jgi:hypothetical protein
MASSTDYICDLTGHNLRVAAVPIVVRLQVAVVPGALVNPSPETLHPFLRQMLFMANGRPRNGLLELSADAFLQHATINLEALAPAFAGPPPASDEVAQLRATVAAREAEIRRLHAEKHDLKHEQARIRATRQ